MSKTTILFHKTKQIISIKEAEKLSNKEKLFSLTGVSFTREKPRGFESQPLHFLLHFGLIRALFTQSFCFKAWQARDLLKLPF